MKILHTQIDVETQRVYCPSTDEEIFVPFKGVNDSVSAFIAWWHHEILGDPVIKDPLLKKSWEQFIEEREKDDDFNYFEGVVEFLEGYNNDQWIVLVCEYMEMGCGPFTATVFLVVKSDTIVERDPRMLENDN